MAKMISFEIPEAPPLPESWYRLPADGEDCPHSGMRRRTLVELIREKKIKARYYGGTNGFWLIERNSVNAWINTLPDTAPPMPENLPCVRKRRAAQAAARAQMPPRATPPPIP